MKKILIDTILFDNTIAPSYEDYLEWCKDNEITPYEDCSSEFYAWCDDTMRMDWDDLIDNIRFSDLNDEEYIISGDVGTWRGRLDIVPMRKNNLVSAIIECCENTDFHVIKLVGGEIKVKTIHHDGTNYFTINLLSAHGKRKNEIEEIKRDYIKNIYGYLF